MLPHIISTQKESYGKRIIDISELVDVFEAQEGLIYQIIGKTGMGKTYYSTYLAMHYLKQGYAVYTTWHLNLPEKYDERKDFSKLFWSVLFPWRKRFYEFDFKKNWHHVDINREDLIDYVSGLTDCILMMDEGQDIFDARERADKTTRKSLTRTRHLRKTLYIISQRAQAVDVTARANVTYFYKCVKTWRIYWPFKNFFKVYRTEEMDNQNYPIWEDVQNDWKAEVFYKGFAKNSIYNLYNSWYLRAGIPKSQEVKFNAYDLSWIERLKSVLFYDVISLEKLRRWVNSDILTEDYSDKVKNLELSPTIKNEEPIKEVKLDNGKQKSPRKLVLKGSEEA